MRQSPLPAASLHQSLFAVARCVLLCGRRFFSGLGADFLPSLRKSFGGFIQNALGRLLLDSSARAPCLSAWNLSGRFAPRPLSCGFAPLCPLPCGLRSPVSAGADVFSGCLSPFTSAMISSVRFSFAAFRPLPFFERASFFAPLPFEDSPRFTPPSSGFFFAATKTPLSSKMKSRLRSATLARTSTTRTGSPRR